MNNDFWKGKTILVTGHTGFKGAWLSLWLQKLGAYTIGYSISPPTFPNMFETCGVGRGMVSIYGDILDEASLRDTIQAYRPSIIFHLAAQSLVRPSYNDPIRTLATNIMGTATLLNIVRDFSADVQVLLNITSDKCYENQEWLWGYRENEPMGGYDPYSCSKGCSELVTTAFRKSYFAGKSCTAVATARAGNVIGGGDWAEDRLIPDVVKYLSQAQDILIRNPESVRPWQHVMEPLSGYLILAEQLWLKGDEYAEGWNFGPSDDDARSVKWVVDCLCRYWGDGAKWRTNDEAGVHEAKMLKLDCSKAKYRLGWRPRLTLEETLLKTVDWYKAFYGANDMRRITFAQIEEYECRR